LLLLTFSPLPPFFSSPLPLIILGEVLTTIMAIDMEARGDALENEYFHRREQELIAKMRAKLEQEDSKDLDLACPKCDGMLVEADFQSIKIDVCNKCSGVWLDPGELAQVVDHEKEGGWFGKLFG
jgi:Transcription factor zinc-finger